MAKGFKTGGGSRKGVPNKATADIKALAQEYTEAAIHALAALGGLVEGKASADSDAARVSALNALLDRGHGKPSQFVEQAVTVYNDDIDWSAVDSSDVVALRDIIHRATSPKPADKSKLNGQTKH